MIGFVCGPRQPFVDLEEAFFGFVFVFVSRSHLKSRFFMGSKAWNAAGANVIPNTTDPTFLKQPIQSHQTSGASEKTAVRSSRWGEAG